MPDNKMRKIKTPPCGRTLPSRIIASHGARIASMRARLQAYLTKNQLKHSDQRFKIAELILTSGEHLTAPKLVSLVESLYPQIGAATVYRNIKVLCDAGILKETLFDADGLVVYEIFDDKHHDHMVCTDCGAIFEFHDKQIESLQEKVAQKMGFTAMHHKHVIYARCNKLK